MIDDHLQQAAACKPEFDVRLHTIVNQATRAIGQMILDRDDYDGGDDLNDLIAFLREHDDAICEMCSKIADDVQTAYEEDLWK
jgi:hypothetical protein